MKQFFVRVGQSLREAFTVVDWKDVLVRSVKTFAQAYAAFVATALASGGLVYGVHESLWLSALAAGIAAVWNGVLAPAFRAVWHVIDDFIGSKTGRHPPDWRDEDDGVSNG